MLQGDIESYAAMSPKDLTDRFEHISGSETYRKEYHQLEQQKLKAEEQTSFLFSKRKNVTQEKKQKKEQKDEAEKHVRMQQELVSFYNIDKIQPWFAALHLLSRLLQSNMLIISSFVH